MLPGGVQSLTEGLEGAAKGPRIYDTDAIDSTGVPSSSSSSAFPEYHTQKGTAEWGSTSSSSTSSTLEELERLSKERSGRYVRPAVVLYALQCIYPDIYLLLSVTYSVSVCTSVSVSSTTGHPLLPRHFDFLCLSTFLSLSLPRLAAIQRRISETSGDLRSAISSASSLRDKLSSYVDKIDKVGAKSKVSK